MTKQSKIIRYCKALPRQSRHKAVLLIYLRHMAEQLAVRLRRHQLQANSIYIGWRNQEQCWLGTECSALTPLPDGHTLFQLGKTILEEVWHGETIDQIQVTAVNTKPVPKRRQHKLFN